LVQSRIKRTLVAAVAGALLPSCGMVDQVMNAVKQSDAVSADLAKSLGIQPRVDFDLKSNSGMTVRVIFDGIPSSPSMAVIAEKSRQAVLTEFQQPPPQRIIVGFALPTEPSSN
jgi:hypothetical protein